MHPVLFKIPLLGGLTLYSYGFLVALGFLAAIYYIVKESRRLGQDVGKALDLIFYIIVSAIIGSRLLYLIIQEPALLIAKPWSVLMVWEGGLVFHGGLISALIVSTIFIWKKHMSLAITTDIFAPGLALGHAFGRIGCLMAGCCFGREAPAGLWWAITFPEHVGSFAPGGIPLYPTQLVEALGNLLIFLGLFLYRKHKLFDGMIFSLYLISYALLRFFIEFLRGDPDRGYPFGLEFNTAQWISFVLFAAGLIIMIRGLWRRSCAS